MLKDDLGGGKTGSQFAKTIQWLLVAVVIIAIVTIVTKIFKSYKAASETIGDLAGDTIVSANTGITMPRITVCRTVANDCDNATTRLPIIGTLVWCDDNKVESSLNRLETNKEAALTSALYKQISGYSLKDLVENHSFITSINPEQIKEVVRQNLS